MGIELVTKFQPYVDDMFATESKRSLLTNNDFDWTGAHTVKIYKITTSAMNDYDREGAGPGASRYGAIDNLDATTEEMTLKKDRSFTFAIDKLDNDETGNQLSAASALARQCREVVVPEIDSYVYAVMAANAGTKAEPSELTEENIYDEILKASLALDDAEVPETGRSLVVSSATYNLMKKCKEIVMETNIGNELRLKGVISILDGFNVVKVPSVRLPKNFGFMAVHPSATVAPVKLEEYKTHSNPPGISGDLVEGRICYDAFVLENKTKALYYHATE